MTAALPSRWHSLLAPGIATFVALAILMGLGFWQLERKAWKEDLIARIATRSSAEPGAILPEAEWRNWRAEADEFRRVRVTGIFLNDAEAPVYGLAPSERGAPLQGYYLFTPLRLASGAAVIVNRGFVPTDKVDPTTRSESLPQGKVTVTGLIRAPEPRGWFLPENRPAENRWFIRSPQEIASAKNLARVAPFYVEADATPNPGGWPKGGQRRLSLSNNHLQYALTWFGIAAALIAMFAALAWQRLRAPSP